MKVTDIPEKDVPLGCLREDTIVFHGEDGSTLKQYFDDYSWKHDRKDIVYQEKTKNGIRTWIKVEY